MTLLQHVFISYSRQDMKFADRLVKDLERTNIPTWIDREGVHHYDRSFEAKIREALNEAFAAILIATPDSLISEYVQGEMDIVREREIPLIVLWADGERYTDTVPTFLTRRTYVDCRRKAYPENSQRIIDELIHVRDTQLPRFVIVQGNEKIPRSHLSIRVDQDDFIAVQPHAYSDVRELLMDLYLMCLQDRFPRFTYGTEWIIVSLPCPHAATRQTHSTEYYERSLQRRLHTGGGVSRVALPLNFLSSYEMVDDSWQSDELSVYGLNPATCWDIVSPKTGAIFAVISNLPFLPRDISSVSDIHVLLGLEKHLRPNFTRLHDYPLLEELQANQAYMMFSADKELQVFKGLIVEVLR